VKIVFIIVRSAAIAVIEGFIGLSLAVSLINMLMNLQGINVRNCLGLLDTSRDKTP
jgi:hypothetical protein